MKFNLKMIAAAVALAAAGSAHADFIAGSGGDVTSGTGNSTLGLLAWNISTGAYYLRDTGFTMNTFLPSTGSTITGAGETAPAPVYNKTPTTGLTLNSGNTASFADASFSTWLSSTTAADVRWTVMASDSVGTAATNRKREIGAVASGSSIAAVTNGTIDNGVVAINGLAATFTGSTTGTLNSGQLLSANGVYINQGGTASTSSYAAALGGDADLFYWTRSAATGSTALAANALQYGNAAGFAKLNLASNGNLSYTLAAESVSAVPVPAAAWLLGSGLVSFGAFARRRRDAK